jgi:hypothetical protein
MVEDDHARAAAPAAAASYHSHKVSGERLTSAKEIVAAPGCLRKRGVTAARPRSSPPATAKIRRTDDDRPVHSWRTLLVDLATLTRNTVRLVDEPRSAC